MSRVRFRVTRSDGEIIVDEDLDVAKSVEMAEVHAEAANAARDAGYGWTLEVFDRDGVIFPAGEWTPLDRLEEGEVEPIPLRTIYVAICEDCTPILPVPFIAEKERDSWADQHAVANRHRVVRTTDPYWP